MGIKQTKPTIGVLALQGDFLEHRRVIEQLHYPVIEVRTVADAKKISGLILPGGESTVIGKLLQTTKLDSWIKQAAKQCLPIYGTCAGAILLAKQVDSPYSLRLINIQMKRNAYGRQLDSFETTLSSQQFPNVQAAFIRAPRIVQVGQGVTILLEYEHEPVLVQAGNIIAGTFHSELMDDNAIHRYFIQAIDNFAKPTASRAQFR